MPIYCTVVLEVRRLVSGIVVILLLKTLTEFSLPSLATRVDQHPLVQDLIQLQNASDPITLSPYLPLIESPWGNNGHSHINRKNIPISRPFS